MAKQYALIIGVNNYQYFEPLNKAEADANSVASVLKSGVLGEFASIQLLDGNVTAIAAGTAIKSFFTNPLVGENDLLLLFFAGHGHREPIDEKLYFAVTDSQEQFIELTGIDCYHLRTWMRYSRSKRQLVLLDCCYSGYFLQARTSDDTLEKDDFINKMGRFAITSAAKNKRAYESIEGAEHLPNSPFTQALIEGLKTNKACDDEGELTARNLHSFIEGQLLAQASSQQPKIFGPEGDNDLILKKKVVINIPKDILEKLTDKNVDARLASVIRLRRLAETNKKYLLPTKVMLSDLKDHERDRHVYDEMTHLLDMIDAKLKEAEVKNTSKKAPKSPIVEIQAPTIITPSKTRQPVDVFQDPLKIGGLGPKMIVIPGGEFLMGSPEDEFGREKNEGPQHKVVLKSFAMSETAVTFNDYELYCNAVGNALPDDRGWGKESRPVINVSWNDTTEYLQWLNDQTGRIYRLPSEAQWEYACRAGTTTAYNTGATITAEQANFKLKSNKTVPVKSYPPNRFGLYEMHGNVWEWCEDDWHDDYTGAPNDEIPWLSDGRGAKRVLRGGCWGSNGRYLRSATRDWDRPSVRNSSLGLRLSRGS